MEAHSNKCFILNVSICCGELVNSESYSVLVSLCSAEGKCFQVCIHGKCEHKKSG